MSYLYLRIAIEGGGARARYLFGSDRIFNFSVPIQDNDATQQRVSSVLVAVVSISEQLVFPLLVTVHLAFPALMI